MGAKTGSRSGSRSCGERAEARRRDAARAVVARAREFFGGIWFKVFCERGPCVPRRSL